MRDFLEILDLLGCNFLVEMQLLLLAPDLVFDSFRDAAVLVLVVHLSKERREGVVTLRVAGVAWALVLACQV